LQSPTLPHLENIHPQRIGPKLEICIILNENGPIRGYFQAAICPVDVCLENGPMIVQMDIHAFDPWRVMDLQIHAQPMGNDQIHVQPMVNVWIICHGKSILPWQIHDDRQSMANCTK